MPTTERPRIDTRQLALRVEKLMHAVKTQRENLKRIDSFLADVEKEAGCLVDDIAAILWERTVDGE